MKAQEGVGAEYRRGGREIRTTILVPISPFFEGVFKGFRVVDAEASDPIPKNSHFCFNAHTHNTLIDQDIHTHEKDAIRM